MADTLEEKEYTSIDAQHPVGCFAHHGDTHGNVVALEGDAEIIDTQLRLLPPSSNFLLLFSLKDGIHTRNGHFNARELVRDVHREFTMRSALARDFLKSSTSSQPRMVFMNGGCVGARTFCITQIADKLTKGNIRAAEEVLDEIVKDGVVGILKKDIAEAQEGPSDEVTKMDDKIQDSHELTDPCSVAMRAAENLDRETAELQPEFEHKIGNSAVVPFETHPDTINPLEPSKGTSRVLTNATTEKIQKIEIPVPSRAAILKEKRSTFGRQSSFTAYTDIFSQDDRKPDSETDAGDEDDHCSPTGADDLQQNAQVPAVEFGRACIVDVQSARPSLFGRKRSSSIDQPRATNLPDTRTQCLVLDHATFLADNIERPTTSDGLPRLRTNFTRASEFKVKKSPTRSIDSNKSKRSTNRVYVDRGTNPVDLDDESAPNISFQPVFPVLEDLVINFVVGKNDPVTNSVIMSYKNGSYPLLPHSQPQSMPTTPHGSSSFRNSMTKDSGMDEGSYLPLQQCMDCPHDQDRDALPQRNGSKIRNPGTTTAAPLTPASTPPPQDLGVAHIFLQFAPLKDLDPVGIQNSFRRLLDSKFPPASTGYKQYAYASDVDRLWKPVFRVEDSAGKESRTVDQIIAIGCEEGVRRDFVSEIAGGIEKLGMKQNGISRSGRPNIGYIIANAMQSYTLSHPPMRPSSPHSNPAHLASLLVPQLEGYLAANSDTRLLILQYPVAYLPTVLHLRTLLGTDIFKIAAIIESTGKHPSLYPDRTYAAFPSNSPTILRALSWTNSRTLAINSPHLRKVARSEADFLLSDSPSASDIEDFFSQIQHSLTERSSFYTSLPANPIKPHPAPAPKPNPQPKPRNSASDSLSESSISISSAEASPYTFAKSNSTIHSAPQLSRSLEKIVPRSRRSDNEKRVRNVREGGPAIRMGWEAFEMSEDEDEFDHAVVQPGRRKGNSRKALKWLGLLT